MVFNLKEVKICNLVICDLVVRCDLYVVKCYMNILMKCW